MNKKNRKKLQKEYSSSAIKMYFSLLKTTTCSNIAKKYVKEILNLQTAFTLTLTRDEKKLFCKKCLVYHPIDKTLSIRFNSKFGCIEYICTNCSYIKRFKYK